MIKEEQVRIRQIRSRIIREKNAADEARQKQVAEQERLQNFQSQFNTAGQLINVGEFDKAEEILKGLLTQDPDNGNIQFYLVHLS